MTLLEQMKERRIVRIMISYIMVGWIILQVFDQIADRGVVDDLVYHIALIWFLFGLPATLLIGWHHGEKGRQKAPLSEIFIIMLLAMSAVGTSMFAIGAAQDDDMPGLATGNLVEMRSIAVRYFEDVSSSGEYAYLADGLTEALIAELQQVQGLDVVSRNGSGRFRDASLGPDSIARALGVGTLVEGDVDARGDRLRVNLRVLDGEGNVFRRATIEEPLADLVTLRESVIGETALLLRQWIGEEVRVRSRAESTESSAAWALLQRAERVRKEADQKVREGDTSTALALFQRADHLLAEAEQADPSWVDPVLERAFVAYRRSRAPLDITERATLVSTGLAHVGRGLAMQSTDARGLETRGTLKYWSVLAGITSDPAARVRMVEEAQKDLEDAVRFNPALATAHASLSHLYLWFNDDVADAVLAASTAYRQDAYLENVEGILDRLFVGSLELGNFRSAKEWCTEGRRRFATDFRFINCELTLMMAPFEAPDPDSAWTLFSGLEGLVPARTAEYELIKGEMMVGAVLARADLADSARAVVDRASARVTAEIDPGSDLLLTEAYARVRTGEKSRAIDLLTRRLAAVGPKPPGSEVEWWWRDLQDEPRFRRLWGLN